MDGWCLTTTNSASELPADANGQPQPRSARAALLTCLGVSVLMFALYAVTARHYPRVDDAGELMAAAACLGIAHPSGYPLLTMLGKAASFLPLGSVAYRLNLLVAVCGAAAAGALSLLVWTAFRNLFAAGLAGLAFGLTPVLWRNSTSFEVYSLNALLIVLALLFAVRVWVAAESDSRRRARDFHLLVLIVGLGMSHHLSFIAVLPALAWLGWSGRKSWLPGRRQIVTGSFVFILGLSPWLYLPIRGALPYDPYTCWMPLRSLRAVFEHITAGDYRNWLFNYSWAGVPLLVQRLGEAVWGQLGLLTLLATFGVVAPPSRGRSVVHAALVLMGLNLAIFFGYAVEDYEVFYLPSYLALSIFAAAGFAGIAGRLAARGSRQAAVVLAVVVAMAMAAPVPMRLAEMRSPSVCFGEAYIEKLEEVLPPDAIVIIGAQWSDSDSISFPVNYAKGIEGRLPGVTWENFTRIPGQFSYTSMGAAAADELTRDLLREIGASPRATWEVLAVPPQLRNAALLRSYDGARPLFTDSPGLLEDAGLGGAYHGYLWRALPEREYRCDLDPEEFLNWATSQAARPDADASVHDNLSLPFINYLYYLLMTQHVEALSVVSAMMADACGESLLALRFSIEYAKVPGDRRTAWAILRRFQTAYPYHEASYRAEAGLLLEEERYSEALAAVNKAAGINCEARQEIATMRALCYLGLGEMEKAEQAAGPELWPQILRRQ